MGGLAASILLLRTMLILFQTLCKAPLRWVCDNKAALSQVDRISHQNRYQPSNPDYVVSIIRYDIDIVDQPLEPCMD